MVLVAEKAFRFLKYSCLLSFLLYISIQIRVQVVGIPPKDAPFYPRTDALSAFFVAQSILQLIWLRRLFLSKRNPQCEDTSWGNADTKNHFDPAELPVEVIVDSLQASFAPFNIAGNAASVISGLLWLQEKFVVAQVLCVINLVIQLYAVFTLLSTSGQFSLSQKNWLTHIVAKTSVGLGLLYVWKGWGIIDDGLYPPVSELIQTIVISLLLTIASGPDPTLGLCLLYDLVALVYGPGISSRWRNAYKYDIAIIGATVLVDYITGQFRDIKIVRDVTSKPPNEEDFIEGDKSGRLLTKVNTYV